ncbi:2-methoxy-6-polyprenyl-1,4-benzoquinol methylase, mitochondrial [Methylobacterium crusticola]|uniref:2-methoxy-6-polyprenyl-1,4-benzoquinol methylase, mitochondrial n=1 Tax=Methylobacterium crusticola TaxID=1697972 RepID=A0ABQ4R0L6_9HYPH|nr:methyltransferase domain-containing protein [Methylobacterium crusticola]GJD51225.1 2-methoxy-6-polyprenyl-1,4-benzoquinol methylase, mitochondrial [Methylobacterium crusticola]
MTESGILEHCARGAISPQIALARLLLAGEELDVPALARLAAARPDAPRLAALARLAEHHRDRLGALGRLARSGLWPGGDDVLAATAALFDRLADEAPEAGVAFYSLGDPAELAAATDELAGVIRAWSPPAGRRVLDFGCGIGRVAIALADEAGTVLGLDLSARMVAEARRRAGDRGNLRFERSEACRLPVGAGEVDLLVAADSLPFVVRADALAGFMAEAARVLGRGGDLLVFNWSYRGDPGQDVAEARALAAACGFEVLRADEHPFAIWDAAAFHLRRAA